MKAYAGGLKDGNMPILSYLMKEPVQVMWGRLPLASEQYLSSRGVCTKPTNLDILGKSDNSLI